METTTNGSVQTAYERGLETMHRMWGDEPATMIAAIETDFNREIVQLVISSCFGECWSSDVVPPRIRSLVTVAIVAALGRPAETEMHVRWALRNGCTNDELREVVKHVTAYAGAPAGMDAAFTVDRVLAEAA
jgi:4-carboxymuconolactone decarboxylase